MKALTFFESTSFGLPLILLVISMSLKLILSLKPVPIAFTNASFAANLFAKKLILSFFFWTGLFHFG